MNPRITNRPGVQRGKTQSDKVICEKGGNGAKEEQTFSQFTKLLVNKVVKHKFHAVFHFSHLPGLQTVLK